MTGIYTHGLVNASVPGRAWIILSPSTYFANEQMVTDIQPFAVNRPFLMHVVIANRYNGERRRDGRRTSNFHVFPKFPDRFSPRCTKRPSNFPTLTSSRGNLGCVDKKNARTNVWPVFPSVTSIPVTTILLRDKNFYNRTFYESQERIDKLITNQKDLLFV